MGSHIDPATGRNKRETGKLAKRQERGWKGGHIKKRSDGTGKPAERRVDQKRRQVAVGRKGRANGRRTSR